MHTGNGVGLYYTNKILSMSRGENYDDTTLDMVWSKPSRPLKLDARKSVDILGRVIPAALANRIPEGNLRVEGERYALIQLIVKGKYDYCIRFFVEE